MILRGSLASTTGACPICGCEVPLRHGAAPGRVTDRYSCARCGPVTYESGSAGALAMFGGYVAVGLAG